MAVAYFLQVYSRNTELEGVCWYEMDYLAGRSRCSRFGDGVKRLCAN